MPTRSATKARRSIDGLSLADLRKVTKPGSRRAEARIKVVERDRVVSRVTKDVLMSLVAHVVIPVLDRGRVVEVRWSHLNRPGMTPWVQVVPTPTRWEPLAQPMGVDVEPDLGLKDGRDILHIIPRGNLWMTRCGLDSEYAGIPVSPDAQLERCPICFPK
jgi:hypothetical protein